MTGIGTSATSHDRQWMAAFRGEAEVCDYEVASPRLTWSRQSSLPRLTAATDAKQTFAPGFASDTWRFLLWPPRGANILIYAQQPGKARWAAVDMPQGITRT